MFSNGFADSYKFLQIIFVVQQPIYIKTLFPYWPSLLVTIIDFRHVHCGKTLMGIVNLSVTIFSSFVME